MLLRVLIKSGVFLLQVIAEVLTKLLCYFVDLVIKRGKLEEIPIFQIEQILVKLLRLDIQFFLTLKKVPGTRLITRVFSSSDTP